MNNKITWGDILISTCRKMFLNKDAITVADLPDLVDDRNYSTYINMAPDVMNELMVILNNRILININRLHVNLSSVDFEEYITETPIEYEFNIAKYCEDNEITNYLYCEVIQHTDKQMDNLLFIEQDGIIYIDKRFMDRFSKNIVLKYRIIPTIYTNDTDYEFLIELPYNVCSIVPLYLASELYKDDDISLATSYRNQFETELDYISSKMVDSLGTEHSRDVGGYYGC